MRLPESCSIRKEKVGPASRDLPLYVGFKNNSAGKSTYDVLMLYQSMIDTRKKKRLGYYLSMMDTLTNLSDCGMVSSGAGLGVARYLLDMVR